MKAIWTEILIQEHFDSKKDIIPLASEYFKVICITTSRSQGKNIIAQVSSLWPHKSSEKNPSPIIVVTKPPYHFGSNPPWHTESWNLMAEWMSQFDCHVGIDCESWLADYKLDKLIMSDDELGLFVDNMKTCANKFDRFYVYGVSPWMPYKGGETLARATWSTRTRGMMPFHNRHGRPYERDSWVANWGTMESFNVNRTATLLQCGTRESYDNSYVYHKPWPADILINKLDKSEDAYEDTWQSPIFCYGYINEFIAEWHAKAIEIGEGKEIEK